MSPAAALGLALALVLACDRTTPRASSDPAPTIVEPDVVDDDPTPLPELERTEPVLATGLPVHAPTTPPPWRDASGALVEADHWLPGPARRSEAARDPAARLVLDAGCRRCHAGAAHEWSGSQHAGAWSSDAFQHAFTLEPRAFCQRCHAPEEPARTAVGEVSSAASSLGVGCVTCHVQPGTDVVWAAPQIEGSEPASDDRSPHPLARSPLFAGPQACAACHEFSFPDALLREHPLAMQSTITEHGRSAAADRSCADCHMPRGPDGERDHAFSGAYDPATLARALEIEATREGPTTVRLRLRPGEVGHAVPTGDLLRRLMVEVHVDGPDGAPPFTERRWYGRRYGPIHQANGIAVRGELGDDRIGPDPEAGMREATFELPAALADRPVRWRVVHQRVAQQRGNPRTAPIEGELEFAAGVLDPP